MEISARFTAKYSGQCPRCVTGIIKGQPIRLVTHRGDQAALHDGCEEGLTVDDLARLVKLAKRRRVNASKKRKTKVPPGATAGRTRNGGRAKVIWSARNLGR